MRYPRQRQAAEIESEIARVRREMDETLGAIESRLTTDHLVDQGIAYLRQSGGREFVSNLGTSVKENPLSVTLVGIGLAWLMLSARRDGVSDTEAQATTGLTGRPEETLGRIKEGAAAAGQTVSRTMRGAAQAWTDTGASVRDRTRDAVDRTRHQAERVRRGFDSMLNEQPLVLGAIGIAVGAAIAAAAPRTRAEDEWMGEASDRIADEMKRSGEDQLERMREAISASREPATGEAGEVSRAAQRSPQPSQPGPTAR